MSVRKGKKAHYRIVLKLLKFMGRPPMQREIDYWRLRHAENCIIRQYEDSFKEELPFLQLVRSFGVRRVSG